MFDWYHLNPNKCFRNLAEFYNTSIDYLLYETDERKPYPKSVMKKSQEK